MDLYDFNPPAEPEELRRFEAQIGFRLPDDFHAFYRRSNGGTVDATSYAVLWRIEELLCINRDARVDEFAPGHFIIGTNGGGEAYAIEKASGRIVMLPWIVMSDDAGIHLADTFDEFLHWLSAPEQF